MVALAAGAGALSGAAGALISALRPGLPTGPTVVLVATGVAVASLLGAPRRGIVARALRQRALRRSYTGAPPDPPRL
jgi:manganese/zinc/iron transport system permease protein